MTLIRFAINTSVMNASPNATSKLRLPENPNWVYSQCKGALWSINCGLPSTEKNGAIDAIPATVENAITIESICAHTTHRLCRGVSTLQMSDSRCISQLRAMIIKDPKHAGPTDG